MDNMELICHVSDPCSKNTLTLLMKIPSFLLEEKMVILGEISLTVFVSLQKNVFHDTPISKLFSLGEHVIVYNFNKIMSCY